MAFPYATTVTGLSTTLQQLRSAFPPKVNADTLRKWGIAANNESSILQTLRFLNVIDEEGSKNADAAKAFVIHDDAKFAEAFDGLVRKAYNGVFEAYGDKSWDVGKDKLITLFRNSDQTSARVGEQQAATFLALAAFAGHGPAPAPSGNGGSKRAHAVQPPHAGRAKSKEAPVAPVVVTTAPMVNGSPLTVSVRVELNLPVTDDQGVYDKIFRSIRENLINA